MPSLFGTAIVAACVGVTAQYNQACNNAIDAGTRQIGLRDNVDKAESMTTNYANAKAEATIGKDGVWVVGSGYFVYKTVKDKSVQFRLPNLGFYSSATNQITTDSYRLNINWNF